MSQSLELLLPEPERRRAAALAGGLADFLYVPGPGFVSPLEPGLYRSSYILVLPGGSAVRVSSLVVPAFRGECCRLRLEPVQVYRAESLGSFFDPSRRGLIYMMSSDRQSGGARPAVEPGWSYEGPPLRGRLGALAQVRLLRERVTGTIDGQPVAWSADRGLVLGATGGEASLLLALPETSEHTAFLPSPGLYRALLDPAAPAPPGATVKELLGYGDREGALAVRVELERP